MTAKNMGKLSVFILLMILANMSRAEIPNDSITTNFPSQDLNINDAVVAVESTTIKDDGASLITETSPELDTTIENESDNNVEDDGSTTEIPKDSTPSTESVVETSTDQVACVCDCIVNGKQVSTGCSTKAPEEVQTETTENNNNDSTTNAAEGENSTNSNDKETTSSPNAEVDTTTASESNVSVDNSTQSAAATQTTTLPPAPICITPGVQAHELDCQKYYDCCSEGSEDGSLHLVTKTCPEKQAFNIELNRCSRDISSCSLDIQCLVKGGIADPASNSSYYLCEPRLIGVGFRIFHVDCGPYEIFYPELEKCFIDIINLPTSGIPIYGWNQPKDIDIVKVELKLLKQQDKLKLKAEKDRQKVEEKLQKELEKELEKEAKKKAKEEEKVNKKKAKQEAASFVCVEEGNFASQVKDNIYYACIIKKDKLKAIPMQCSFGATFNPATGTCVNSLASVKDSNEENKSSVSEDEDDD